MGDGDVSEMRIFYVISITKCDITNCKVEVSDS